MKRNASIISASYFAFFVLMIFSGTLSGVLSNSVYYLAYLVPVFLVLLLLRGEKIRKEDFTLSKDGARLSLPLVFPTVLAVMLLSIITSFLIFLVSGKTSSVNIGDNVLLALLNHALAPAVLEELLFRYLPFKYIAPHSRRYCVFFSAVTFALVHHSFFSIPYALFAGCVFMTLDLLSESVLPSVIVHFVNNAVSVLWTLYFPGKTGSVIVISAVAALALVSLIIAFLMRSEYTRRLKRIFSEKSSFPIPLSLICLGALTLLAAIFELVF